MKIKLKNAEIQEYVNAPASAAESDSTVTQLMNVANQSDGLVFEIPDEYRGISICGSIASRKLRFTRMAHVWRKKRKNRSRTLGYMVYKNRIVVEKRLDEVNRLPYRYDLQ